MTMRLRALLLLVLLLVACGGPNTRLVTVDPGKGEGKIDFSIKNLTDVPLNTFFLAKTEAIDKAGGITLDPTSPEGTEAWGPDLLGGAVGVGKSERIPVPQDGSWEARAVDSDGREQHITHLKLKAGGRYVLELYEGGWRVVH
jgi:hypothetical protein